MSAADRNASRREELTRPLGVEHRIGPAWPMSAGPTMKRLLAILGPDDPLWQRIARDPNPAWAARCIVDELPSLPAGVAMGGDGVMRERTTPYFAVPPCR